MADQVIIIFSEGGFRSYQPVVGKENVLLREAKDVQSRLVIRMLSVKDGNNIILRYFFKHENRVYVFEAELDAVEHLLERYNFDFDSPDFAAYIELFESAIASMRFQK
jgi:GH15 family glucan-1,4-alpha-glucosidase